MRIATYNPASLDSTVRALCAAQEDILTLTTPATIGAELEIPHGLGKIPNGYAIINQPYSATAIGSGRGDTAWTKEKLYLKFSVASTALTIKVE